MLNKNKNWIGAGDQHYGEYTDYNTNINGQSVPNKKPNLLGIIAVIFIICMFCFCCICNSTILLILKLTKKKQSGTKVKKKAYFTAVPYNCKAGYTYYKRTKRCVPSLLF